MSPPFVIFRRACARLWPVLLFVGCATPPASYVMLIESPDGSTGQVVVSDARGSRVLNRAKQATGLDGSSAATVEISDEQARRDFSGAMVAQPPLPETFHVYFESRAARMTQDSLRRMDQLVEKLRSWPAPELLIVGHTDTVASRAFNERLGMERARAVVAALVAKGVAPLSMTVESRGERELLVATPDEVDEPRNRRVVVSVR